MANFDLVMAYGETLDPRIEFPDASFGSNDLILFVIRQKGAQEEVVFWKTYVPTVDNTGMYFILPEIVHLLSEQLLQWGKTYKWGIALYRDAVVNSDGVPVDGYVKIPIIEADLKIMKAVAREQGLVANG
jgi:hypothetical protein